MYRIERQDQLYKTLPQALFFSPTIVVFSALTLLLPLSGVFAPGSLTTVTTQNSTDVGPCMIPTGYLSTPDTPNYSSLYNLGGTGYWTSVTPRATGLTTQWLVEQRIPDLPQACGPNCCYNVSIPSFIFQCTPNPSSLPYAQGGIPGQDYGITVWNGTMHSNSLWGFYIAWKSNGLNGTSGNASCSPVQAQYHVKVWEIAFSTTLSLIFLKYKLKVQTKAGVQSVTTNITQITSPLPNVNSAAFANSTSDDMFNFLNQLASISYATQALFLGSAFLTYSPGGTWLNDTRPSGQPSFLEIPVGHNIGMQFVWGDVLKGIEEMSHNVTVGLLTLQLGTMRSNCSFDQQDVQVYRYSSRDLWVPYGVSTMLYSHVSISPFPHYVL
jgi:hypothetical protein